MRPLFPDQFRRREFSPPDLPNLSAWYSEDSGRVVDSAGAVSSWSDKSVNGRTLLQAAGAAQPISTRPDGGGNLLALSEGFTTSAYWAPFRITTAANVDAPTGFSGSVKVTETAALGDHAFRVSTANIGPFLIDKVMVAEVIAKADGRNWMGIGFNGTGRFSNFDLLNGVVGTVGTGGGFNNSSASITPLGGGWFKCRFQAGLVVSSAFDLWLETADSSGVTGPSYLGDGVSAIKIAAASLRYRDWRDEYVGTTGLQARPGLAGKPTVYFNGTSHFMKTAAFTLNQPATYYFAVSQPAWTADDRLADGDTLDSAAIYQATSSPRIGIFAGVGPLISALPPINSFFVLSCVFNGANSVVQHNISSPTEGDAGASNAGGFTLCNRSTGLLQFGNFDVAEVVIYNAAHDAATRLTVQRYLSKKWSLLV